MMVRFLILLCISVILFLSRSWIDDIYQSQYGGFTLNDELIEYVYRLNQITKPVITSKENAKENIQELLFYDHVMKKYGFQISEQMLDAELSRLATNTRRPDLLKQVMEIEPKKYYRKYFVRETLVKRLIYGEFYWQNAVAHQGTKLIAENLFKKLLSMNEFEKRKYLQKADLNSFEYSVSAKKGFEIKKMSKNGIVEKEIKRDLVKTEMESQMKNWFVKFTNLSNGAMVFTETEFYDLYFPKQFDPSNKISNGIFIRIEKVPFSVWIDKEKTEYFK